MTLKQFLSQNLRHYKRYYLLIALAVALANTIITGSLLVGDSVKHTLVSRVDERLGRTVTLVTSGSGFMDEAFADVINKGINPLVAASTVFFTNGFVPHGLSLFPVSVWGIDSTLTAVAAPGFVFPDAGEVVINRKVANELSLKAGDDLVVRLPNTQMIPSGSLFVSDNYTASLRLRIKAVIDSRQSGNLNLRNEQSLPFNLFINRQELTSELEMEGKCNIIMLSRNLSGDEFSASWTPEFSGIKVAQITLEVESGITNAAQHWEVISEAAFLEEDLIARLNDHYPQANHLFSYLVNDISTQCHAELVSASPLFNEIAGQARNDDCRNSIPYSFVTAIDHFAGRELTGNDMLLSDYAALRLNASVGDSITLAYYTSAELKILTEEKRSFVVREIIPIHAFQADGRLSAEYPGLSNVDNCTDWDADLTIDMDRITKEDEDYWDIYRSTPKALIAYTEGASMWGNNYGVATAVRISGEKEVILADILSPADAGIVVVSPRETGLAAARGGVDFKSLFLSLAFFVIAAALLLATIPLGGMLHDRRKELLLLQALGYTSKRIKKILLNEITVMTIVATLTGMIVAVLYNRLVLFALGNIWRGAVHTENFLASVEPVSLIGGSMVSLLICFVTVWRALRRIIKRSSRRDAVRHVSTMRWLPVASLVLMHALLFANFAIQSPLLFMLTGIVSLLAAISGYAFFVNRNALKTFNHKSIIFKNLHYRRRSGIISVAVLSSGLFVVFSVGLNRKSFSDASGLLSGTGGFTFWGDHSVPLYHSLSTPEGREKFGLSDLPVETSILQLYRHGGDDASCLNLNKAPQPTVLGVDADRLADASFTFASIYDIRYPISDSNNSQFSILNSQFSTVWSALSQKRGDYYPVIADQTVLQWGLLKSVGDTITYRNRKGEPVVLQFIGGLNNSIFQGNLLMDKSFFAEIWGEDGSEVMLVQTSDSTQHAVKQLLSQALANYGLQLGFCNERLKEFNSVTDSYLTIFLMLGGFGLLIGLFGMLLIIRRGLLDRAGERSTLSAVGFETVTIQRQLFRESMLVPLYAIVAGTLASLVAVASAIPAVSLFTWATLLVILVLLVIIAWGFIAIQLSKH
jgi:putative ABC transport system permease protein